MYEGLKIVPLGALVDLEKVVFNTSAEKTYSDEKWGESHFSYSLPGKEKFSFLCIDHGKLIGLLIGYENMPGWGYVSRLAVHPEYHGRGIGSSLLNMQSEVMFGSGMKFQTMEVSRYNERAVRLYNRLGFHLISGDALSLYCELKNKPLETFSGDSRQRVVLAKLPNDSDLSTMLRLYKNLH